MSIKTAAERKRHNIAVNDARKAQALAALARVTRSSVYLKCLECFGPAWSEDGTAVSIPECTVCNGLGTTLYTVRTVGSDITTETRPLVSSNDVIALCAGIIDAANGAGNNE